MQINFFSVCCRPAVVGLTLAVALTGAFFLGRAQAQQAAAAATLDKPALVSVLIKPDKGSDYEAVIGKLKEALQKTEKAELKQAAAGWKVYKSDAPGPNGNLLYLHLIDPPAAGADYGVMKILYDAFPADSQALYNQYKEAFIGQGPPAKMTLVADLGK
jgi:hypothetical protein